MPNPPTFPRSEVLAWAQSHTQPWIDNDVQIGLSAPQALAVQNAYEAALTAIAAQTNAKSAAESATMAAQNAMRALQRTLADSMRLIRAHATSRSAPAQAQTVYQLAQIPAPAAATPAPPPGTPGDMRVSIDPTAGALTLNWKCTNPPGTEGTSYIVMRRSDPGAEFAFVGATGVKRFTDDSFAAGPPSVQYTVRGQRGDLAGPVSAILTVNFGRTASGRATAKASSDTEAMKLAA